MALRSGIEAGKIYVASAVTAGGLEGFTPWPATTGITICADRDDAKTGAAYRRGEIAARKFALRQYGRVEVAIALPGMPKESIDWLDIL